MGDDRILLAHGGGGALTRELVEELLIPALGGNAAALPDACPVPGAGEVLLTTDSFVVKPLFFRGGDIGRLSVFGTVNDLAVSGARPLGLSLALVIEEGLPVDTLRQVVESVAEAASRCAVRVVTGDTKVVPRGDADQLFITTAGVGQRVMATDPASLREGDHALLSGPIAEHGIAVMSQREGLAFDTVVQSDCAPVWPCVSALHQEGVEVHAMRDPTRGGLAAACVELADASGVTVLLEEAAVPVRHETRLACELLGLDPLAVPNEGKLLAFVAERDAGRALALLRQTPGGEGAADIGRVVPRRAVAVSMSTIYGAERIVEMPYGEELPRIC